ncbi:UDP-glucose 4-epimerase GalE [Methylocella tundrae]|uniref:UDP-glucose 4-epimerase n=1 Tax=Methylocella tundrae TaxID=227605 RepID=A0A4U8YVK8_METTU|nr:UDP-glucose 4-epimerase GalE [Methylocella tundrae]WPP05437.1 UDP-glucose 4-epimerase GalE [Methylocella tundrae]VFU07851.1 UDP-glucose 4-epimerase [Methylocella tundrae]
MTVIERVIVTGGAGYIGSHTCKELASAGIEPIVYDNLLYGHRHNVKWGPLVVGDILDHEQLAMAFKKYRPQACIHFAALAYVGESVERPSAYYRTNVTGTLTLLSEMLRADVHTIVFSSTCATYGVPDVLPVVETTLQNPINPYGASKLMVERILADYRTAYGLRYACLRYFNACGADLDAELQEEHDPETHLIPRCLMAVAGRIPKVDIYGDDYPTPDGTCVRDYIHVTDLARGHVAALSELAQEDLALRLNLGTGQGFSIRQILAGIETMTGRPVPHKFQPRRVGDPPSLLADVGEAKRRIGFVAKHSDLETILRTAWRQYRVD